MIWIPATLAAIAVFIVMQPDPTHRLEAILGGAHPMERNALSEIGARLFSKGRERSAARQQAIESLASLSA